MEFGPYRDRLFVGAHDAPANYQFQIAGPMQKKRPSQGQLDRSGTWQKTVGLKKHAAATDVQSAACAQAFYTAMLQQPILYFQINGIPALGSPVTWPLCWRRNSTLKGGNSSAHNYPPLNLKWRSDPESFVRIDTQFMFQKTEGA
jgi:hypothetical protein